MVDTVKLLRELIAIPSINPAFLAGGHPHAGEGEVARFLEERAREAGLESSLQPVAPGRANVLIRLLPRGQVRKRIVLAPHLDTVGAAAEQLTPKLSGGRVFGRGACDTKGALAAMFAAMCDAAEGKRRPEHTEILLAGLIDEEHAQIGSRFFGASGIPADLAVVGEPTRNRVVTAHKGNLWIVIETRGKAAHGSRPELGRNAVHTMARVVDCLETTYARSVRRRLHPLLGHGTVNVGAIHGGTQPNIVPDRCSIQVDRRTLPGETQRGVLAEISSTLRQQKLTVAISMLRPEECLPLETDSQIEPVPALLKAAGQTGGAGVDYFCDASILSRAGIPSVVFGPGDIAQAHTSNEWISVRSLEKARVILRTFLQSLPWE
jgi:acetylornithine deacetylase/succinyl-diaminopimelate desuccinylase-like protein